METEHYVSLKPAEKIMLHLSAQGLPASEIADKMHISEWTVTALRSRVFCKLGVSSITAAIAACAEVRFHPKYAVTDEDWANL